MTFEKIDPQTEQRCRANFTAVEISLFDNDSLPKLWTAEEASKEVHVSAERLTELADAGLAPCVRIDGGAPLFFKRDITRWLRQYALEIQKGQAINERLKIVRTLPDAVRDEIPEALRPLEGRLKSFTEQSIPACIYFLIDDDEIVYVGQTIGLSGRIQTHRKEKLGLFEQVLYLPVPQSELDRVEQSFIRALRPRLNIACSAADLRDEHAAALEGLGMNHLLSSGGK